MRRVVAAALVLWAGSVFSQVTIERAWTRSTAPKAKLAAGYLTVRNVGAADRLVGASSPSAERVELHVTLRDGEIMRMRRVDALEVPPNGTLELRPAGAHLMFIDIRSRFRDGEKVPVTLRFERAGEVSIELTVGLAAEYGGYRRR